MHGRLVVDRTPFAGFAAARNVCMRSARAPRAGDWVAFVDADEVHDATHDRDDRARTSHRVPPEYDFVDGYTWHFFQSFDYYTSIERRMMFFRFKSELALGGAGPRALGRLDGKRVALPYVYAHYGHTLEPRRHAEKGRHYSSLGAPGDVLREEQLDDFDVVELLRAGVSPPVALSRRASACRRYHAERLRPQPSSVSRADAAHRARATDRDQSA